jgi:hypothetical protein
MLGGISGIILPCGMLGVAIGFAYALTASRGVDPKFTLLESLLRFVDHQPQASHHKHAA